MHERPIVVVDTETSGLNPRNRDHIVVEVAWWDLESGESGTFVPPHSVERVIAYGQPEALRVNRYVERLADADQDSSGREAERLHAALTGATLAGANPTFDVRHLGRMFEETYCAPNPEPWHHRPLDTASYAAGVLGTPPGRLYGLAALCEALGIEQFGAHTAMGDVHAAGECILALQAIAEERNEARPRAFLWQGWRGRRSRRLAGAGSR